MAPEVPKTHKAAVFKEAGKPLVIEDVETPQPKEGQVLVKVLACGVCHSDMMVQQGAINSLRNGKSAIESAGPGTVATAVSPSTYLLTKTRRTPYLPFLNPTHLPPRSGTCKYCTRGTNQVCLTQSINGVSLDGGYAQYVLLRTEAVVRVPATLSPVDYAPFLCAGVTVFNSMRHMSIPAGALVAVQGLGGLGHLAVQYAAKMGYKVVVLSSGGGKEAFARELGASEYVDGSKVGHAEALQEMGGAAMIVSTAPNPEVLGQLQGGLERMGKLLILSPSGEATINTMPLVVQGQTIAGWPSGHAKDSEEAIEFASKNGIKCLVESFPLEKANEAFDAMASGKVRFRAVLTM
ncbi:uncharacterized protein KY384_005044 [Bacidia gigantensis]|uniref:uncharacterized protein n=1 Tax=Bacidia gigantensis TaxID=2732470 RepID=UPI001D056D3D|nr:uncharacterized protein KY384_005044 [Bacidia gigantensis]KAG8530541.1 hypothetical protein KY384_005044 [Bacidia gigantensis]